MKRWITIHNTKRIVLPIFICFILHQKKTFTNKKKRFIEEFKLSPYEANILVSDIDTAKYFEEALRWTKEKGKSNDLKGNNIDQYN